MKEWLSRTQLRQRPMLAVYAGLLILIAAVIGVGALSWLSSRNSDRLAVIGNLLSLGTLLLALVAGVVALAAFAAATGLPNLKVQFSNSYTGLNQAEFTRDPQRVYGRAFKNCTARIIVENTSTYAARTPAVVVEFRGAAIYKDMYAPSEAWTPIGRGSSGDIQAIQWDGGPNYAIHGNSIRHLPVLNLQGVHLDDIAEHATPGSDDWPRIVIKLLADGYNRPEVRIPFRFTDMPAEQKRLPEWL